LVTKHLIKYPGIALQKPPPQHRCAVLESLNFVILHLG